MKPDRLAALGIAACVALPGSDSAANSSNPARAILDPDILQSPFGSRAERSNAGAPNGFVGVPEHLVRRAEVD